MSLTMDDRDGFIWLDGKLVGRVDEARIDAMIGGLK